MKALWVRGLLGAFVALLGGAVVWLPAPAAVAGLPSGSQYVALGDSYSAGYGISPSTGQPVVGCDQSVNDYPHQVAASLHLALTDVTCSGAVTANIDTTGQTQFPGGAASPPAQLQETALNSQTKLVTLTIGGNDLGFATIAAQCLAGSPTGPVAGGNGAANCKSFLDTGTTVSNPEVLLTTTVIPALDRVMSNIRIHAPNAKILVLQYPAIAPTAANTPPLPTACFRPLQDNSGNNLTDTFPFTNIDVPYLHTLQADLNAAVDAAAAKNGAITVPAFAASDAHSACAATAQQWVNGITLTARGLAPGALHPNPAGVAYLTSQVVAAVQAAFPAPTPTPSHVSTTTAAPNPTTAAPAATTTHPTLPTTASALAATGARHTDWLIAVGCLALAAGVLLTTITRAGGRPARRGRYR